MDPNNHIDTTTSGTAEDLTVELGLLSWLDVLTILDGLQLVALEQHRLAVLSNDELTRQAALSAERHADELGSRLETVAADTARVRPTLAGISTESS